ncbi:root phototropism protein 2-like isoform X1 [Miscanthus floridulus]|uniref:root phototropism protein 2-like isoform X1 n=1 Tax=Miscanthus floridulus TaxID=154761 RepID=UPI00345B46B8
MPPLWYLLSLPDPAPPCTEAAASYSTSSSRVPAASITMDTTRQQCSKVSSLEMEIPADLIIRIGDSIFPLHKAVMVPKCGCIRRAVAAATTSSKGDADADDPKPPVVELDLSALPGGADAFEKAARYCYGANFEITPANAAALRCAAAFLDMRHPSADLARRVDEFLARSGLRTLPGAIAVLRSCEAPDDDLLRAAAEELGVARRAADAVALGVCREALFPTTSSSSSQPPGWWKAELAALLPRSFGRVVTALRCRRADPAVVAAAAGSYAELVLAEVLAAPRDCADQRALLESVVDVLPSPADGPGIPAAFLCRLLHAAVATEASAKACRDLELRVAAVLDQATAEDLLGFALDAAGERVRNTDTVRRVVTAFVERQRQAAAPESERRRSRRASMSGTTAATELGAGTAGALEKVARTVDEVAAEIATEEALPISKFVGVAGAVPKDARPSHDCLYRAVDIYLKTHPALDEIQREKVCSVMDPLKLSYQARLHASQNKRLPLQAVLSALYYDQLKLRSVAAAAATSMGDVVADTQSSSAAGRARAQAMADAALARENEALRLELARMRAYMSEMQHSKGSGSSPSRTAKKATFLGSELARMRAYMSGMHHSKGSGLTPPSSPSRTAKKASFLGSVSRSLSRLNPFKGGWTTNHTGSIAAVGRQCKTMHHHHVVTPKRRRSSIG